MVGLQRGTFTATVVVLTLLMGLAAIGTWALTRDGEIAPGVVTEVDPGRPVPSTTPPTPTPSPSASATLPPVPSPTCRPGRATAVRVLSFNIRSARGPAGVDLARVAEEIRASGADVVLLQEVDRFRARTGGVDQAGWLARRLGMRWAYAATVVGRPASPGAPRQEYGIATLTRFGVDGHEVIRLPRRPGTEPRVALRVDARIGGQQVGIYNTHLDHSSSQGRTAQARHLVTALGIDDRPLLLGGDLNAVPGSTVHRALTGVLGDVWSSVGHGAGLTVPARSPRRRIDFVLADDRFTPVAAAVAPSAVSDHRAVRADLHLDAPACP